MLGRRGPAQAAFTNAELRELGRMAGVEVVVEPAEAQLDPVSEEWLAEEGTFTARRNVERLKEYAAAGRDASAGRTIELRFLRSPAAIRGTDHVEGIDVVTNEITRDERGVLRARPVSEATETIPCGLVLRSVGYQAVPLPDVPFDERSYVLPNDRGRVLDLETGEAIPGVYAVGWIKRGPTGILGTNKRDAEETVRALVEDLHAGRLNEPVEEGTVEDLLQGRDDVVTGAGWSAIDRHELAAGAAGERPRVKLATRDDLLGVATGSGGCRMTSAMRETMAGQADALARLLEDDARSARRRAPPRPARADARHGDELARGEPGRRAAAQGRAGRRRRAVVDVVLGDDGTGRAEVVLAFTHTGPRKRFTAQAIAEARGRGLDVIQISGEGIEEADLVTVAQERSAAYTASHLGALLRTAQLAVALGAELPVADVPGAVENAFRAERDPVPPPARLIEFTGGGINAWTAAEGALKIRETSYVASEGLGVEQLLHGPSVALRDTDHLVSLDGGGAWSERLEQVADAAERTGTAVTRIRETALGEPLSIFPLTVAVQRVALESAEALGTDPDTFGMDIPGRLVWREMGL